MMENEVEINYWRSIQNEVDEVLRKPPRNHPRTP